MTGRLLAFAALCFAVAAVSLLAHRRMGYAVACAAGAWFTGVLALVLRRGREDFDSQAERWVAGLGCGCPNGDCTDCDLRLDDR